MKGFSTWTSSVVPRGDPSSLGHHALHHEGFFGVVEAEEGRLAETQHAACKTHIMGLSTASPAVQDSVQDSVQPVRTVKITGRKRTTCCFHKDKADRYQVKS